MIEHLASQPALPGALDQILHAFGSEEVAEVTGRPLRYLRSSALRLLKDRDTGRLFASHRPASANLAESQAFLDDQKRILIFSDAGGTGRSYHADLGCANQRRRVHYLLEAGWRADNAIQGLGQLPSHQSSFCPHLSSRGDNSARRTAIHLDDRSSIGCFRRID